MRVSKSFVEELSKLPDQFVGHEGHEDLAPAVSSLLDRKFHISTIEIERQEHLLSGFRSRIFFQISTRNPFITKIMCLLAGATELQERIEIIRDRRKKIYHEVERFREMRESERRRPSSSLDLCAPNSAPNPAVHPLVSVIGRNLEMIFEILLKRPTRAQDNF